MSTNILQEFPIFPILFLFFDRDLVNFCICSTRKMVGVRFIDNVNILIIGNSTKSNYQILEYIH